MNIDNLYFFNSDGYNLNFKLNPREHYWEGNIYLPKVSIGLYTNATIYVLEEDNNEFHFPSIENENKIKFYWDKQNKFVDEFFMFNFDESYTPKETSSLTYTPNDGPKGNTLLINRFDEYEIDQNSIIESSPLPIYIAFHTFDKFDANTYKRTLYMSYGKEIVAKITFFAETVEEDERLKVWNSNLGYNITPEDTLIFKKSDIKEYRPDYQLLNEKRKELIMEGHNIYPYIGSYKAIINALKFFGYNNLSIIEFWKNVNKDDENFGKIYHSSKYSLTKKETLRVGAKIISLPNKNYKKINRIALVYSINKPTGKVDYWELPEMIEEFEYTIEDALIKLFALKKKLNAEFMPATSRIIDIIGEANYFGLQALNMISDEKKIFIENKKLDIDFDINPGKYIHLEDERYFKNYIYINDETRVENSNETIDKDVILRNIFEKPLSEYFNNGTTYDSQKSGDEIYSRGDICEIYKKFYEDVYINNKLYIEELGGDTDDADITSSAFVVLEKNSLFEDMYQDEFTDKENKYAMVISDGKYTKTPLSEIPKPEYTYTWTVKYSENQYDEELRNIGKVKNYKDFICGSPATYVQQTGDNVLFRLKNIGYYDVTIDVKLNGNIVSTKTKQKCIKVEPYELELKGFYYDNRELPSEFKFDKEKETEFYNYVNEKINDLLYWANTETTSIYNSYNPLDFSMPTFEAESGKITNTGPYRFSNIKYPWYLLDNLSYDIAILKPYVKYARYIRDGVDVKPYTWFLLTYNYGKIVGKINEDFDPYMDGSESESTLDDADYEGPVWTITNNLFPSQSQTHRRRYLTLLIKEEGNYTITLSIKDNNGNRYTISRNILVVSDTANYKIYQPFRKEYDFIIEQQQLALAREFELSYLADENPSFIES